jgi:hypothetical protein
LRGEPLRDELRNIFSARPAVARGRLALQRNAGAGGGNHGRAKPEGDPKCGDTPGGNGGMGQCRRCAARTGGRDSGERENNHGGRALSGGPGGRGERRAHRGGGQHRGDRAARRAEHAAHRSTGKGGDSRTDRKSRALPARGGDLAAGSAAGWSDIAQAGGGKAARPGQGRRPRSGFSRSGAGPTSSSRTIRGPFRASNWTRLRRTIR